MSYDKNDDGAAQKYETDLKFWREAANNNAERANRYYYLLKDEHHLSKKGSSPWECTSDNCPYVGKPMAKNCGCFFDKYREHKRQIVDILGEA